MKKALLTLMFLSSFAPIMAMEKIENNDEREKSITSFQGRVKKTVSDIRRLNKELEEAKKTKEGFREELRTLLKNSKTSSKEHQELLSIGKLLGYTDDFMKALEAEEKNSRSVEKAVEAVRKLGGNAQIPYTNKEDLCPLTINIKNKTLNKYDLIDVLKVTPQGDTHTIELYLSDIKIEVKDYLKGSASYQYGDIFEGFAKNSLLLRKLVMSNTSVNSLEMVNFFNALKEKNLLGELFYLSFSDNKDVDDSVAQCLKNFKKKGSLKKLEHVYFQKTSVSEEMKGKLRAEGIKNVA